MKYMILIYASQRQYDALSGKPSDQPAWSGEDFAALGAFMESFNRDLAASGELVETRGLDAPIHTRRVQLPRRRAGRDGRAVRRDRRGPRRLLDCGM